MPDSTRTAADFTAEDRAEWRAVIDREEAARQAYQEAESSAGSWLMYAITNPDSAGFAREQAESTARDAIRLLDEWKQATAATKATAYGAWLSADIDARLARRRAEKAAA